MEGRWWETWHACGGTICGGGIADRRVIISADDFGLSDGVTRGILEAHRSGAVTAASMFANAPGLEGAVRGARETPSLDLGLHFNLTVGAPLIPAEKIPSLCGADGQFLPLRALAARAFRGRVDADQVARECLAQLDRLRAAGIPVTHIDGHRHVHVLPGVWRGVVGVARRSGLAAVRVPVEPAPGGRAGTKMVVTWAWRLGARGVPGPRGVDHFRGIGLLGSRRFADGLLRILDRVPPGDTEVMVHPGYVDADLLRWDRYGIGRERELAALRSPEVLTRFRRGDFRLIGFADL
jgi:predicted glycoside hydrolase/deacetylase ChbG (UPF0249 family)